MTSSVAFKEAQDKLAELIDRAKGGEEIVIERDGKSAAKLVPVAGRRLRQESASLGKIS